MSGEWGWGRRGLPPALPCAARVGGDAVASLQGGAMGPEFGRLAYVRHIITYSLSPFEQRPFAKYFSVGLPNLWRRFRGQVLRVGPRKCGGGVGGGGGGGGGWARARAPRPSTGPSVPAVFMAGYALYLWAIEEEQRLKRKNPADYVNDE